MKLNGRKQLAGVIPEATKGATTLIVKAEARDCAIISSLIAARPPMTVR